MLEVKNLTIKIFDHSLSETVVYDVHFSIHEGEILGIVGESGSGKTMTALAIAGLLSRHDMEKQGKILFNGVDLLTCDRKMLRSFQGNDIGIIFQEPMTSLNPVKKIGWQVEEALSVHTSLSAKEKKERALEALLAVELTNPEKIYSMYPHQLSGGMRQRVMIAAAIIMNPKLLIADEATTALDVTVQAQIIQLLININATKKMAILFISHDLSLVKKLCDKVLVMKDGKIIENGNTDHIFTHPSNSYTQELIRAIPKWKGRGK